MRRWFVRLGLVSLVALAGLATVVYLRPVATMTVVQRALLRLSGIESHAVQVGGHTIHYLEGGAGPPLLLLHGHPSRAIEWAPLLPRLTESHRVLALDFLGYGESDAPDIDYAVPTQAKMVEGFLDSLGIARVDLLGFSMGGWVALTVARDQPQRIERLVLVGSGGLRFPTTLTPDAWVPQSLEQFRAIEREQGGRPAPAFLARDLIRTTKDRAWALRRSGARLLSFTDALDGQLGAITTPTLIVWGREERVIPYATGERMQHELANARLLGVPGCGHLVLWECPEAALPPILEFLARPAAGQP